MYVVLNRVIADIRICGGKKTNIFVFVFGEKNAYADQYISLRYVCDLEEF